MDKEYLCRRVSKEQLYRIYEAVHEDYLLYNKITKRKMLDCVEIAYQDSKIMKGFISNHEFELLKEVYNNHSMPKTFKAKHLLDRFLLMDDKNDSSKMVIPEELIPVLQPYLENEIIRDGYDRYDEIIIGLVNFFGVITYQDLFNYLHAYIGNYDQELMFDHLSSSALINYLFLCPEDYVLCRYDLFDDYDYIMNQRSKIQNTHILPEIHQLIEIGAYSMDTSDPAIVKMMDQIFQLDYYSQIEVTNQLIYGAHMDFDFHFFNAFKNDSINLLDKEIFENAYECLPSASYYGMPLKFQHVKEEQQLKLDQFFENQVQINAHLSKEDAIYFYQLYYSLLEYINERYAIYSDVQKIEEILEEPQKILKIREVFVRHPEEIDRYIRDHHELNEEDKEIIHQFKYHLFAHFVIVKHEKDFTLFMNGKDFYAVIGSAVNVSEMISSLTLPAVVDGCLFPFKGKIVVDGLIESFPVDLGMGFKKIIVDQLRNTSIIHRLDRYH